VKSYLRKFRFRVREAGELILLLSLIPILKLNALMFGASEKEIVRKVGRKVKTPITFFTHKETNKQVVVFSMVHLGNKVYYKIVQELIDALHERGFPVIDEGISLLTPAEKALLSPAEQRFVRYQESDFLHTWNWAQLVSIALQGDRMRTRSTWTHADISFYEMARLSCGEGFPVFHPDAILHRAFRCNGRAKLLLKYIANKYFYELMIFELFNYLACLFHRGVNRMEYVRLDYREKIVYQSAMVQLQKNEAVVIPWGAAHLPGLAAALKQDGYEISHQSWLNAYKIKPHSSWFQALRTQPERSYFSLPHGII
jgi:hypothetical protein